MNIFYLSNNIDECVKMHNDSHVRKMVIEYPQLLSTAHRILDGTMYYGRTKNNRKIKRWRMDDPVMEEGLMKASHVAHPSNLWVRSSNNNYTWLFELWQALLDEYAYRYGKEHACRGYTELLRPLPKNIPVGYKTQPTPAMPDDVKNSCSVTAYRDYYIKYKQHLATWKGKVNGRSTPEWYVMA